MKQDQKGLWSIENYEKGSLKWKMYKVPVDNKILDWKGTEEGEFPKVYEGQFEIEEVGDVYLDMSNYGKGYIWMNGNNLGRYWI